MMMVDKCKHGHDLTPSNISWTKLKGQNLYRVCRRCKGLANKRYRERMKEVGGG